MKISSVRHAYPELKGFVVNRKSGFYEYTFLHFHNSVKLQENGTIITAHPHSVIIYSPDAPQFFLSSEPLIHDWFHFSLENDQLFRQSNIEFNKIYYPQNPGFITKIVAEIEGEHFGNKPNSQNLIQLKSQELILKLGRAVATKEYEPQNRETKERFRQFRGQMFISLNQDWTIKKMAEAVYLSESRFFALYKKFFGISPMADLINAKMNSAKNMLLSNNRSVDEIATALSYDNTTHFIRQFKGQVGTTPARYRRLHRDKKL